MINIQFSQTGNELPFDEQKAIFIFRIFQEVLNNILKHAQATNVIVNLNYLNDKFILQISDNGIGFDVAEKKKSPKSGVGLKSIFNRAQLIGAVISIKSEPNGGTLVLLELPLNEDK
jgi:signal transduction histidine kinase